MTDIASLSEADLQVRAEALRAQYDEIRGQGLKLDVTRGKPSAEQLSLSDSILTNVGPGDVHGADGTDYRNYGILAGIPEARELFAEYMGVTPAEVLVGGNSSLTLMHDALVGAMMYGVPGGYGPWKDQGHLKFLCPVPGYDRHFGITQKLGFEMVPVAMSETGPDMDAIEELVAEDASVKGIWCVPKYSNPTGIVYSDATVDRLAGMSTAALDFRIMWDNAYAVHHLGRGPAPLKDLLAACKAAGNPERVLMFGSTSKITHAGAGVAVMAASETNIKDALAHIGVGSIGPDKINQLRHVRFFQDLAGLLGHMDNHAGLVAPKFAAVMAALNDNLAGKGIAEWTEPEGGYFVSVDLVPGTASKVVRLANDIGVKFTPAGATFPLGQDPEDRNVRLAPTLPPLEEIEAAMQVFCVCVELAAVEKRLGHND